MCRNIKPLFNFEPPATDAEVRDAALQFVPKLSGSTKPSMRTSRFGQAVDKVAAAVRELLDSMERHGRRTARKRRPRRAGW